MAYPRATPLPRAYYERATLVVARDLLGKVIWRRTGDELVAGTIVETEAYISAIDPASHNYGRPSKRAQVMYGPPGHAYVYLSYGMHYCLNVVTEGVGTSAAVLIRALEPREGIAMMQARRPKVTAVHELARGPANVCRALSLTLADNGVDLTTGEGLWISLPDMPSRNLTIAASTRIGISKGTDLPWRFFVVGSPAVSGPRSSNHGNGK
jgi:DNA-3-methyladenine glycosylase